MQKLNKCNAFELQLDETIWTNDGVCMTTYLAWYICERWHCCVVGAMRDGDGCGEALIQQ